MMAWCVPAHALPPGNFPADLLCVLRASEGVMTHLVESIEETPFLNRSVEAFFAEGLEVRNVPWAATPGGKACDVR